MIERVVVVAQVEEFLPQPKTSQKPLIKSGNTGMANLSSLVQMMANTIIAATITKTKQRKIKKRFVMVRQN